MTKRLKLAAETVEDLRVLNAVIQDGLVRACDMVFVAEARRFVMVFNRFRWEKLNREVGLFRFRRPSYERVRSGLHVDDVLSVQTQNMPAKDSEEILVLLDVAWDGPTNVDESRNGTLTFTFSGNISIALTVELINVHMSDLGDPWETKNRPDHELEVS